MPRLLVLTLALLLPAITGPWTIRGAVFNQGENVLAYRGDAGEPLFDLNRMAPGQIEAIEFYAGPAQTPLRYSGLNSVCGVLVIHTRRSP